MGKHFEKNLPEGYHEVYRLDAKNSKIGVIFNLVAFFVTLAISAAAIFIIKPYQDIASFRFLSYIIFFLSILLYVVLHEIVHGIAYKALTKEKLTFGISLTVAFCGVPNIYVYRKTALVALLSPFVVFTVVFLAGAFLLSNPWDQFLCSVLLGIHVGGCSGDLYDTGLYLFRFRSADTLMRDTGPMQVFYEKDR